MRFVGSVLASLLLLALIWVALHDILKGEQDVWQEYSVLVLSLVALAGLVYFSLKRRSA
jgi:hypothetical protein